MFDMCLYFSQKNASVSYPILPSTQALNVKKIELYNVVNMTIT